MKAKRDDASENARSTDVDALRSARDAVADEPGIIRRGRPLGAQESGADAGRYSAARLE